MLLIRLTWCCRGKGKKKSIKNGLKLLSNFNVCLQDHKTQDAWNKTFDMFKSVNGFVDQVAAKNILYCRLPICLDLCSDYTVEELSDRSYLANFQSKAWDADENRRIRFEIECRLIPFPSWVNTWVLSFLRSNKSSKAVSQERIHMTISDFAICQWANPATRGTSKLKISEISIAVHGADVLPLMLPIIHATSNE